MRRTPLIAGVAAASLLLAACSSSDNATPSSSAAGASSAPATSAAGSTPAMESSSSAADSSPAAESSSAGSSASGPAGGAGGDVGVFTWWAAGSEKLGLDALVKVFNEQYSSDKFVNLAVAGGAGSNAKAKLASDLQAGNPPDSFQGHAGAELSDYIAAGQIEPVDDVIAGLGGEKVFPKDLLDRLTVDGHIYSVPSNIHRANVVWVNSKVLKDAGLDPTKAPADIAAWIKDMETLKAKGIATPLTIGGTWTQVQLFETVLISTLGPEAYSGLFDGTTKWDDPKVTQAIADYKTLLTYANTPADGDDWPPATDLVIDGKAAYNVMGDWAVAEFASKNKKDGVDYNYWAVPGQEGVYDFLADSFTLPKGAPNAAGTKDWLNTVGSADGQEAFNLAKGSIPARTDVKPDNFPPYQQWAMGEFTKDKIVSSIAHGAAVSLAWNTAISAAISKFMATKDDAGLQSDLVNAATDNLGG